MTCLPPILQLDVFEILLPLLQLQRDKWRLSSLLSYHNVSSTKENRLFVCWLSKSACFQTGIEVWQRLKRMLSKCWVIGLLPLTASGGNGSEFFLQKVEKSALRFDYSEIKILRPQIREIWEFSKMLETKHLYFLYIFGACKMAHFTLQNGPFYFPKWIILPSRMGHFAM